MSRWTWYVLADPSCLTSFASIPDDHVRIAQFRGPDSIVDDLYFRKLVIRFHLFTRVPHVKSSGYRKDRCTCFTESESNCRRGYCRYCLLQTKFSCQLLIHLCFFGFVLIDGGEADFKSVHS